MSLLCAGRAKHAYVETSFPRAMDTDDTQPVHADDMDRLCENARDLLDSEMPERPVVGN